MDTDYFEALGGDLVAQLLGLFGELLALEGAALAMHILRNRCVCGSSCIAVAPPAHFWQVDDVISITTQAATVNP